MELDADLNVVKLEYIKATDEWYELGDEDDGWFMGDGLLLAEGEYGTYTRRQLNRTQHRSQPSLDSNNSPDEPESPNAPIPPAPTQVTLTTATVPPAQITSLTTALAQTSLAPTTLPTAMSSTGALQGIPPTIFNGEHTESQQFLREFERYQIQNEGINLVDNPYKRVVTAMGMMKGKKVNRWVTAQLKKMKERVTAGTLKTNELLWDEFEVAFTKAWTDSTEKQDASHRLQNLKMKGEDLDEYIAEFEELMTIGGWDEKSEATMILF